MKVDIRFFAQAREVVGNERISLELPQPDRADDTVTLARLKAILADKHPELMPLLPHLLFAVGTEYAANSAVLDSGCEVVCFPPVSGG